MRNQMIKNYCYRVLILLLILLPAIIIIIIVDIMRPDSPTEDRIFNKPQSQTIYFFYNIVVYFSTAFIVFAFADAIFLRAGLYDRAPTPDRIVFNKEDDRLLLQGGASRIIGDDSSMMLDRSALGFMRD